MKQNNLNQAEWLASRHFRQRYNISAYAVRMLSKRGDIEVLSLGKYIKRYKLKDNIIPNTLIHTETIKKEAVVALDVPPVEVVEQVPVIEPQQDIVKQSEPSLPDIQADPLYLDSQNVRITVSSKELVQKLLQVWPDPKTNTVHENFLSALNPNDLKALLTLKALQSNEEIDYYRRERWVKYTINRDVVDQVLRNDE